MKRQRLVAFKDTKCDDLEPASSAQRVDAKPMPGVVTFVVDGKTYQLLEQTIRSRGETLLTDLLDDPQRTSSTDPIFIQGDGERFRHIMDWFRYGSIHLPLTVSIEEMRRDCAFYKLPEDVPIHGAAGAAAAQEAYSTFISALKSFQSDECVAEGAKAAAQVAACALANRVLNDAKNATELCQTGTVRIDVVNIDVPRVLALGDVEAAAINNALFDTSVGSSRFCVARAQKKEFDDALEAIGCKHGFRCRVAKTEYQKYVIYEGKPFLATHHVATATFTLR